MIPTVNFEQIMSRYSSNQRACSKRVTLEGELKRRRGKNKKFLTEPPDEDRTHDPWITRPVV